MANANLVSQEKKSGINRAIFGNNQFTRNGPVAPLLNKSLNEAKRASLVPLSISLSDVVSRFVACLIHETDLGFPFATKRTTWLYLLNLFGFRFQIKIRR